MLSNGSTAIDLLFASSPPPWLRHPAERTTLANNCCPALGSEQEETDCNDRCEDRDRDELASSMRPAAFLWRELVGALDSCRRNLESPRQSHRNWEAEREEANDHLHDPERRVEGGENDRRDLNDHPRYEGVGGCNPGKRCAVLVQRKNFDCSRDGFRGGTRGRNEYL